MNELLCLIVLLRTVLKAMSMGFILLIFFFTLSCCLLLASFFFFIEFSLFLKLLEKLLFSLMPCSILYFHRIEALGMRLNSVLDKFDSVLNFSLFQFKLFIKPLLVQSYLVISILAHFFIIFTFIFFVILIGNFFTKGQIFFFLFTFLFT